MSLDLMSGMMEGLKSAYISTLSRIQLVENDQVPMQSAPMQMTYQHDDMSYLSASDPKMPVSDESAQEQAPFVRQGPKVGRNDPCHCGSGKKFKYCHGKIV